MPRLIDADAMRHRLLCQPPRNISINFALEVVSTMPTVNAEPVRHGRWTWDDEGYYCSECLCHAYGNALECLDGTYQYCPFCGAKMDESNEQLDERGEDEQGDIH